MAGFLNAITVYSKYCRSVQIGIGAVFFSHNEYRNDIFQYQQWQQITFYFLNPILYFRVTF